jgi:hypothetical protein
VNDLVSATRENRSKPLEVVAVQKIRQLGESLPLLPGQAATVLRDTLTVVDTGD